jgi:preprotein translocase subunit Sec61beta
MAEQMSLPGAFGGLMRYNEEYKSKLSFSPSAVILLIILVICFRISLSLFL